MNLMNLKREGFDNIPDCIPFRNQLITVLVEGRRPHCWNCRQKGHVARNCPKRVPQKLTPTANAAADIAAAAGVMTSTVAAAAAGEATKTVLAVVEVAAATNVTAATPNADCENQTPEAGGGGLRWHGMGGKPPAPQPLLTLPPKICHPL